MSKNDLQAAFNKFNEKHTFLPGQIVEWKPGMRNKKLQGPFVVVEVMDTPVLDEDPDAGSPYFREPLDLVLGRLDDDGDLLFFHYDSRRMQPAD